MSNPMIGKENVCLSPMTLSPAPKVCQSPGGFAYDLLLKPPTLQTKVVNITPVHHPDGKDCMEKLLSAEKRKENLDLLNQEKTRQRREKLEAAKCHVLNSIENHQQQIKAKSQKKEETAEELKARMKREFEMKCISRELKALEARKSVLQKEKEKDMEKDENKRKSLSKIKHAEELREANVQAVADKARKVVTKCTTTITLQEKKKQELDEKIRQDILHKTEARENRISSIKEKCANHVKDAKSRVNRKNDAEN